MSSVHPDQAPGRPQGGLRSYTVRCAECFAGTTFPAYRCWACAGPLVVDPAPAVAGDLREDRCRRGVWRRAALLPRTTNAVTLGEGNTPLVPVRLRPPTDGMRVHAKLESLNPTLSFKDRAMALAASVALDHGMSGLLLASTGNAAVSAAAYAAAAGLPCRVLCGTGSGAGSKLAAAAAYGADVQLVEGDYSTAYAQAAEAESGGWLNVTTTYRNPLLAEAYRGMAAEMMDDLGAVPDAVVVPVGAGPLLRGLFGGFRDLASAGVTERVPRLVGVQASACAPLVRAWNSGNWLASLTAPLPVRPTRAGAIADSLRGYEREGLLTLDAVRGSQGGLVAVDEDDLARATTALARGGLLVEPAAAAAVAALDTPQVAALVPDGGTVVVVLTGHGAKQQQPGPDPALAGDGAQGKDVTR
jgi:threonine synthase